MEATNSPFDHALGQLDALLTELGTELGTPPSQPWHIDGRTVEQCVADFDLLLPQILPGAAGGGIAGAGLPEGGISASRDALGKALVVLHDEKFKGHLRRIRVVPRDTLHPTPYTLHSTLYTRHPTPYPSKPCRRLILGLCNEKYSW